MSAKDVLVRGIESREASAFVDGMHYSGSHVENSRLHFGVYWYGKLEGVASFGSPTAPRKIAGLVRDLGPNELLELNRLAFSDRLPRNSESRALGVILRLLRKRARRIRLIVSFADACQCGDGTIYRATGSLLTAVKKNSSLWRLPDGRVVHKLSLADTRPTKIQRELRAATGLASGTQGALLKASGATLIPGFMLRYFYLLDPTLRDRLLVDVLPYSAIEEAGAKMYRGRPGSIGGDALVDPGGRGRFDPTSGLQPQEENE